MDAVGQQALLAEIAAATRSSSILNESPFPSTSQVVTENGSRIVDLLIKVLSNRFLAQPNMSLSASLWLFIEEMNKIINEPLPLELAVLSMQYPDETARCRMWVRMMLIRCKFSSCIFKLKTSPAILTRFYATDSILSNDRLRQNFLQTIIMFEAHLKAVPGAAEAIAQSPAKSYGSDDATRLQSRASYNPPPPRRVSNNTQDAIAHDFSSSTASLLLHDDEALPSSKKERETPTSLRPLLPPSLDDSRRRSGSMICSSRDLSTSRFSGQSSILTFKPSHARQLSLMAHEGLVSPPPLPLSPRTHRRAVEVDENFTSKELERENEHFTICEALIEKIESHSTQELILSLGSILIASLPQELLDFALSSDFPELHNDLERTMIVSPSVLPTTSRTSTDSSSIHHTINVNSSVSELDNQSARYGHRRVLSDSSLYSEQNEILSKPSRVLSSVELAQQQRSRPSHPSSVELSTFADLPIRNEVPHRRSASPSAQSTAMSFIMSMTSQMPADDTISNLNSTLDFSLSEPFSSTSGTRLLGNDRWAPPRKQLIFVIQRKISLRKAITLQQNRCAGCGMVILMMFLKTLRYCDYYGKYFCPSCHSDERSIIPARVVLSWDFHLQPVSHLAKLFISSILFEPYFDMSAVGNGKVMKNVKALKSVCSNRMMLATARDYLRICRSSSNSSSTSSSSLLLPKIDVVLRGEPTVFSLDQLRRIQEGRFSENFRDLIKDSYNHLESCPFCKAKAFICEICNDGKDLLFPFQKRSFQCEKCKDVYHLKCFGKVSGCPKCIRIEKYRKRAEITVQASPK